MRLPLRVGIVGCGNVALNDHIPRYLAIPGQYRVAAVADPTPERLEVGRVAAGLPLVDAHADPAALLGRNDIDVVDLCVPQRFHRDLAVAAARSGRHVLCEKPLATTPADATAMVAAAQEAGVRLGTVHNYLWFPEVMRTLELIAAGEVGEVEVAILNWLSIIDVPGNAAYRPTWRHDPALAGGGVLMDMLHIVYLAEAFLGTPIERVSAHVTARADDAPVEDLAICRFEAGDSVALVNVGWGVGPGGYAVSGSAGRIEVTYRDGGSGAFVPFDRLVVHGVAGRRRQMQLPAGDPMVRLLEDFAAAVADNRPPRASGDDGLHILEVTLAAYASSTLGRTVVLPLTPGDPVFERGVAGLRDLDAADWSPIRRHRIFGVG